MGEALSCSGPVYKMVRRYANSKGLSMREALNEMITKFVKAEAMTMDADELSVINEEMTNPEKLANCPYCEEQFLFSMLEANHMSACKENPANKSDRPKPLSTLTYSTDMPTLGVKVTPLSIEALKERYNNKLEDEQIEACRCRVCNQYYDPHVIQEHERGHK